MIRWVLGVVVVVGVGCTGLPGYGTTWDWVGETQPSGARPAPVDSHRALDDFNRAETAPPPAPPPARTTVCTRNPYGNGGLYGGTVECVER